MGIRFCTGRDGRSPEGEEVAVNFPLRTAQSMPTWGVVGERDLDDEHLDEHLAGHLVQR